LRNWDLGVWKTENETKLRLLGFEIWILYFLFEAIRGNQIKWTKKRGE
jgi:hypothetical protein